MPRFIVVALNALGLRGAAVAKRAIAKLEKASAQLAKAAQHLDTDIVEEWNAIGRDSAAFEQAIGVRSAAQGQRQDHRDRATRIAARLAALVS